MTTEIANETIQQIGLSIGRDPVVVDSEWESLWIVFKIDGSDIVEYGKITVSGKEKGFLLDNDQSGDLVQRLHDLMFDEDGKSWVACKITIIRETRDINIKFEYENESIWDSPLPF